MDRAGFYGKTSLDALRIDEVHGLWKDQAETMVKSRWAQDEKEKAEFTRKVLEEDFPKYFGLYEKLLKENGGSGYLVGDSVSLGDFYLYDMQENFRHLKKDHLKDYPLMQKLCKIVESHPRIKAYLASRKESIM
nr:hypothetical protein BaRGS_029380 [Batillaria attramentaria]